MTGVSRVGRAADGVASRRGWLESLVTRVDPNEHLRHRSIADPGQPSVGGRPVALIAGWFFADLEFDGRCRPASLVGGVTYDSLLGAATMGLVLKKILVVDDDPTVREVVLSYLRAEQYDVEEAADGETALSMISNGRPDLVVLDIMLPDIDGLEVCRRIRADTDLPVILLTALGSESDRVVGLEIGADDYVTKPFSPRELVLRVSSVLRRAGETAAPDPRVLTDGDLVVDGPSRTVTMAECSVALTTREFDLLRFFMANPRTAFTRVELLERVWGWSFGDQSTVTVHVRRLREKVEADPTAPARLKTVWGIGYRWDPAGDSDGR